MDRLVFTCGDVNGIGPEIVIKALNKISHKYKKSQHYFFIPENVFERIKRIVKPNFDYILSDENSIGHSDSKVIIVLQQPVRLKIGEATKESGTASYKSLKASYSLLKKGIADAIITAPVSKTAFNYAGLKFPGQTELFAHWSETKNYLMTFLSRKLNVALFSIHVPLRRISGLLKKDILEGKLNLLYSTLKSDLGITEPKIAVLGLNPHAGEGGIIGKEEKEVIAPVINKVRRKYEIEGPFPADAFFGQRRYEEFNLTFGMYHDQVLIPFKHTNAGKGVNFTAGLPIIRTSPDHGVAYDIAWKGIADHSSLIEAVRYAGLIARNRKKHERSKK